MAFILKLILGKQSLWQLTLSQIEAGLNYSLGHILTFALKSICRFLAHFQDDSPILVSDRPTIRKCTCKYVHHQQRGVIR